MHSEEDYVWRFAVPAKAAATGHEDPLVEMIRVFLDDFLSLGFLTWKGQRVRVDGFAFTNHPKQTYGIFLDVAAPGGGPNGKSSAV